MRHVRILGLCLVAVFAMSAAMTASALAGGVPKTVKNPTTKLNIFDNCPLEGSSAAGYKDELCVFAATEAAPEGGAFTVGKITVPLEKQVQLQYGLTENTEISGYNLEYVAPTDGALAINPTPEKVPGEPIAHISPAEQEELGWPAGLKYSYAQAQKDHAVKTVYETIELAGVPFTDVTNIILEEGVAVEAPVKIKGENKWLSQLGDVCYIGSEEDPITQHLTTGASVSPLTGETLHGASGTVTLSHEGAEVWLTHSDLVDNTYPVPGASCTGPYSSYVETALDRLFELPEPAGASNTQIKGTLYEGLAVFLRAKGI